ncbi:MAG: 5'-deoxynucleotidase [Oscillospiraceae bacterium]|nr:5'-deoxynucleotidase [Oscillospiraceae bacterium]
MSGFFSMLLRMKYINRWGLMRNTYNENLSQHSFDVAVIAHALALIGNIRLGKSTDADKTAVLALFHDAEEILTGDLPTPVKYHDESMKRAYGEVKQAAVGRLIALLPDDMRGIYSGIFDMEDAEDEIRDIIKAADKIAALIKCIEEETAGNREFARAKESQYSAIKGLGLAQADIFMAEFLPAFGLTLDEHPEIIPK